MPHHFSGCGLSHIKGMACILSQRRNETREAPCMRLTKFSDYALRALLFAASRPGERVTVEETAQIFGISRMHLKKVVMFLASEGYVSAARGHNGGFMLARAPETINLGALLRQTEPDFGMVECFLPGNLCPITRTCRLAGVVNEAVEAFVAAFDRRTLADILLPPDRFVPCAAPQPLRGPRLPPLPAVPG
jgi:Rrf2 family nitric oxide-sensitive transcriptional repressor